MLDVISKRNATGYKNDQLEPRINQICELMKAAARHQIRCVRLPPNEPLITEIIAIFEKDGYIVKREYIRTGYLSIPVGDEFVGWIITW